MAFSFRSLPAVVCFIILTIHANAATVTWDGGGGDLSWQNPTNWSGDVLPGGSDDVRIAIANASTITSRSNVTIRSLQCSNSLDLAAGVLRVTNGTSIIHGRLTATNNSTLSVTGPGTSLVLAGAVDPGSANLEATGGAMLALPTLTSYAKPDGCVTVTWLASGAGSVIDLNNLTNVTGARCATLNYRAMSGGRFRMPALVTIVEGTFNALADGSNSVVEMPLLAESLASQRAVNLEARNNGEVICPLFPGSLMSSVAIKSGGSLPVVQLQQLRGLTVSGMAIDFPAVTTLGSGEVLVDAGGSVTLPAIGEHVVPAGCVSSVWTVQGATSRLVLPALTNITGAQCGGFNIGAQSGGTLLLTNLTTAFDGALQFDARGTNSLIDLARFQSSVGTRFQVTLTAREGGEISLPLFTGATNVVVSIQTGGVLPAHQMTLLRGLQVTAMHVDFPALTWIGSGEVAVTGGGRAGIPHLTIHQDVSGCAAVVWSATGNGSVLDLPALTNFSGTVCGFFNFRATAGGSINLDQLPAITEGSVEFLADGLGSLIDLRNLKESVATARNVEFEARNQGTILLPDFNGGSTVSITIKSGGQLDAAQITLLKGLTVSGTSLSLPGITRLFAGDIIVEGGAVLSFPNLANHDQGTRCVVNRWSSSGAGSILDLSSLTNLTGASCGSLDVRALAGGLINASNLVSISEGRVDFLSDGTNSLIDMEKLSKLDGTLRTVSFDVRNSGRIAAPQMTGGPAIGVAIHSNGVLSVTQLTRLQSILADRSTLEFSALTNLDVGSIVASNGAVVTLPKLVHYDAGTHCTLPSWLVRDPSTILELPALTQLRGANCGALEVEAANGGTMILGNVTNIPAQTVHVLATGAGSLIDLHSLSGFLNGSPNSRLVATNGGTILLNDEGLVLSGVFLDIANGTPNLSAARIGATNTVLFGQAWHSYWMENRESADADWEFYQRVPLTNDFQIIDPIAAGGTEFRVREFLADPPALELAVRRDQSVSVVLYGTAGQAVDVDTMDSISMPVAWEPLYNVTLTNSFRILPTEPPGKPQRYFRAVPRP